MPDITLPRATVLEIEAALSDTTDLSAALLSKTIFVNGQYVDVREAVEKARLALARLRAEREVK